MRVKCRKKSSILITLEIRTKVTGARQGSPVNSHKIALSLSGFMHCMSLFLPKSEAVFRNGMCCDVCHICSVIRLGKICCWMRHYRSHGAGGRAGCLWVRWPSTRTECQNLRFLSGLSPLVCQKAGQRGLAICVMLRFYAAQIATSSLLPAFRGNLSLSSSRVKQSKKIAGHT